MNITEQDMRATLNVLAVVAVALLVTAVFALIAGIISAALAAGIGGVLLAAGLIFERVHYRR